jgi:hypothetical protein
MIINPMQVWLRSHHFMLKLKQFLILHPDKKLVEPRVARTPVDPAADLIGKLGELMERYPIALLDSARLPASKQTLKTVIKDVWRRQPALRGQLAYAYL